MDIHSDDPRGQQMVRWLDMYEHDLWGNLHRVPQLPASASSEIITGFLEMACQCQHIGNITLGRHGIWSLPNDWIVERIERIAEDALDFCDEWEYRRLLEVYEKLDRDLLNRLIARGLSSDNEEIKEAAQDFQEL